MPMLVCPSSDGNMLIPNFPRFFDGVCVKCKMIADLSDVT